MTTVIERPVVEKGPRHAKPKNPRFRKLKLGLALTLSIILGAAAGVGTAEVIKQYALGVLQ